MGSVYNQPECQGTAQYRQDSQQGTCLVKTSTLDISIDRSDSGGTRGTDFISESDYLDADILVSDITTEVHTAPLHCFNKESGTSQSVETENTMTVSSRSEGELVEKAGKSTNDAIHRIDKPDTEEEMLLKVVVNYCFYFDLSEENERDMANRPAAVEDMDSNSSGFAEEVSSEADTQEETRGCEESLGDSGDDFDADLNSLCQSEDDDASSSYHLASFSMMNIFDSACDDNYDFTGSLDFNNIGRPPVSTSQDTLDWLSDSSDNVSEQACGDKKTDSIPTNSQSDDSSGTSHNLTDNMVDPVCATGGQVTDNDVTTKHYHGSTFTISSVHPEVRHKLIRRLLSKVFPMKKYVVSGKK